MYSEALTYDYWPIDSGEKRWFVAACQTDQQMCNFFEIRGTLITPKARNTVGETCPKKIQVVGDYMTLACSSVNTVSLYQISSSYILTRKLFLVGVENNDARLINFDAATSMLFFTKSYPWEQGQNAPLPFIDCVVILRDSALSAGKPYAIRFEQDLFYEVHAGQPGARNYITHIKARHTDLNADYGKIVKFSVAGTTLTAVT